MSARATVLAWHQDIKPATAKLVLLCLADCHNGDSGQCNPGVNYIARQTGLDRKTVMHSIDTLRQNGVISVTNKQGAGNTYRLKTSTEIGTSQQKPVPKTGH